MEGSKPPKPSLPFAWPIPSDGSESESDRTSVPFAHFAHASGIAGIASDIDDRGVAWLEELLGNSERKALILLAVYAGCPTRCKHLSRLLKLQNRSTQGTEFRILPMAGGTGAPANCLTLVSPDGSNPVCFFGATPNFGIPDPDPTQFNMAFRVDPALEDKLYSWFNSTWARAAPLTEATARIPALVPATGSADASKQWNEYCKKCVKDEQGEPQQGEESETPNRGVEDDDSTTSSASEETGKQPPSTSVGLHRLDRLAERVTHILGKGQQVTVVYGGALKPLDVPINARFFDQDPEERKGTVVRRQTFRIAAFSKEEQKMIDEYRKASRNVINKLGLPFEKGLYWMSDEMVPIFKKELSIIEEKAKADLIEIVGGKADSFVKSKRTQIMEDLEQMYLELVGKGGLPEGRLTEVLDRLEQRIQNALESEIVAPVTFHRITVDLQKTQPHEAPWAQMEKLVLALARFPRRGISKPNTLSGMTTGRNSILDAMNIEDDSILRIRKDSLNDATRRSDWDLDQLERIADSDIEYRDRCKAYFMMIDGKMSSEIQNFVDTKWSQQRDKGARSS